MLFILFVCTGNTCRSPMAKGLFEKISAKYGIKAAFSSAGLGFCSGQPVSPNAVTVCNESGVDISRHIPRIIRQHDLDITNIFVVMTKSHAEILMNILAVPENKIYILGDGISDPYGFDLSVYRRCRNEISAGLEEFCKMLRRKIDSGEIKEDKNDENKNI